MRCNSAIAGFLTIVISQAAILQAEELPQLTTLSNRAAKYRNIKKPYAVLKRGKVEAVIVDNRAVDDEVLSKHRAGYSGVASLKHESTNKNLFVPAYAGLNFEHIHDGSIQPREVLFEPRNMPMELRLVDQHTVELYQSPTKHWGLESCTRYEMLEDGTLEMTVEFIPHRKTFKHGYIGLFWAGYIHRPESLDIHFIGHGVDEQETSKWIRGVTPAHGRLSTHLRVNDERKFARESQFPLTLVFNRSRYRYREPWYYGVSHGMAFVQMFRSRDQVRFSQSPSGGGAGNPAWDFQIFTEDYQIGTRYQLVMRAMYVPYKSPEQIVRASKIHRRILNSD